MGLVQRMSEQLPQFAWGKILDPLVVFSKRTLRMPTADKWDGTRQAPASRVLQFKGYISGTGEYEEASLESAWPPPVATKARALEEEQPGSRRPPHTITTVELLRLCSRRNEPGHGWSEKLVPLRKPVSLGEQPSMGIGNVGGGTATAHMSVPKELASYVHESFSRTLPAGTTRLGPLKSCKLPDGTTVLYLSTSQKWCPNAQKQHKTATLYVQMHQKWGMQVKCRCACQQQATNNGKRKACSEWRSQSVPLTESLRKQLMPH
jgi:hypothetical protein